MKKLMFALVLSSSFLALNAYSSQSISKDEVDHFKLKKIGEVSVIENGGTVSSPSDLHKALSEKVDAKGGRYYQIIAAREHGPNFEAVAIAYK